MSMLCIEKFVPQRTANLNSLSDLWTSEETPAILLHHPWQAIMLVSQIENLSTVTDRIAEAIQVFTLFTDTKTANARVSCNYT